jgi:MHS family proline/betaine transporter-like MFS transporter
VETRAIGVSLGFSTAVSVFGGLAPLVATWLIAATGDSLSPSYYLIVTALLSLFALMAIQWRSRRATQAIARPVELAVS